MGKHFGKRPILSKTENVIRKGLKETNYVWNVLD